MRPPNAVLCLALAGLALPIVAEPAPRPPAGPSPHARLDPAERAALRPVLARNIAEELNAPLRATAESDRAYPLYLRAVAMLKRDPFDAGSGIASRADADAAADDPYSDAFGGKSGREIWAGRTAYLRRNADALRLIREAAARPHLGMILSDVIDPAFQRARAEADPTYVPETGTPTDNPPAWSLMFPHMAMLRGFARELTADAWLAAEDGDTPRLLDNIRAMDGLARHANHPPVLIGELVGMAITGLRDQTIARLVGAFPEVFSDADLASLADMLGPVSDGNARGASLDGEFVMMLDSLQRIYSDDGEGNGIMTAAGVDYFRRLGSVGGDLPDAARRLAAGDPSRVAADRATERFVYEHFIHIAEAENQRPLWQRRSTIPGSLDDAIGALRREHRLTGAILIAPVLMPALDKAHVAAERTGMTTDATRARIAIERFRRAEGRMPRDLDELVPGFLARVPVDRWDGRELRYRIIDGVPTLYSVGFDGDDDGGRPPAEGVARARNFFPDAERVRRMVAESPDRYDGDFVIIPEPR